MNRFKYGKKWKFIIRIGIYTAHLRLGTWFIIHMQSIQLLFAIS